ncbi:HET-domain-containing protein, partial [Eremomyces bilateralis CBS 781.70]
MRLLNVSTRKLEEFQGPRPRYAILSHTWGKEEVTFEDLKTSDYTEKLGYKKIDGCCKQAQKARIEYVWIDTCCINKSSSAELSEAINSMFEWYARSRVCYIYLSDVPPASLDEHKKPGSLFRSSRWFTRGWTLQELLAPKNRMLFDSSWQQVKILSEITDIRIECLQTIANRSRRLRTPLHEFSVSERMSWASRRKTTREEDVAYCLLGIFGVNMPLLYGEGKRAFHRLQEEIIRMTPDETILCW